MRKLRVYLSHKISDGGVLTEEIMEKNCQAATDFGNWLRREFPNLDVYIPAEHEDFVHRANIMGLLTIPQILDIDCGIIFGCDAVIMYCPDDKMSKGMTVENTFVLNNNIPIYNVLKVDCNNPYNLKFSLENFFRSYIERM